MWWSLLLIPLFLIILLLFVRVRFCILCGSEFSACVRVLFLRFPIYPKKKKIKLRDFTPKSISKRISKNRKILEKEEQKTARKEKKPKPSRSMEDVMGIIRTTRQILSAVVGRFARYLRVDVSRFYLRVAAGDAAKTAIMYGVAVQGVQYVITILEQVGNLKTKDNMSIRVECDYLADAPTLEADMALSLRGWHVLSLLIRSAAAYLIADVKNKKKTQSERRLQNGRE